MFLMPCTPRSEHGKVPMLGLDMDGADGSQDQQKDRRDNPKFMLGVSRADPESP
jgi:hypothetical protein